MAKRKRFGEVLIEEGVIDAQTLERALAAQGNSGKRLGQVLEEQQVITERDIAVVLARQFGLKTVKNISEHNFPEKVLELVDSEKALQKLVFPLRVEGKTLYLAMVNPLDMETVDSLSFGTGLRIVPYLTTPQEIHAAINTHYLKSMNLPANGDCWRILIFDDHEIALTAAANALTKENFEVIKASRADGAVALVKKKHPHLVVAEVSMHGFNGVDLYNTLQRDPATKHIPVIAYSSKSTAGEEAKLLNLGFIDVMAKPVNAVRLVARTRRALRLVYDDLSTPPPTPNN